MYVCMSVCLSVCLYVYVCMYVCMYVRMYGVGPCFLNVFGTENPSQETSRQEANQIPNQGIHSFLHTVSFDHGPTSRLRVSSLFCRQKTWIENGARTLAYSFNHVVHLDHLDKL